MITKLDKMNHILNNAMIQINELNIVGRDEMIVKDVIDELQKSINLINVIKNNRENGCMN